MADPTTQPNPFAQLLTTPALRASREAEAVQRAGDNPWLQMAAKAGVDLQNNLIDSGHAGLTGDDLRASRNDDIIQQATQRFASKVKDGRIDPQEALASVTEDAFNKLLAAGDVKSAAVLAPYIFSFQTQQSELDKLKSTTRDQNATAGRNESLTQTENEGRQAGIDETKAKAALENAQADYYSGRYRGGPADGAGGPTKNGLMKFREQGGNVVTFLENLNDLSDMYGNPGVASNPAGFIAKLQDSVQGTWDLIKSDPNRNHAADDAVSESLQKRYAKQIDEQSKTLNVDRGQYESLVTQLAYQLAIANNGTRPTDKDFAYALNILGASQDPARARQVLRSNAERAYRSFKNQAAANEDLASEDVVEQADETYNRLWGKKDTSKTVEPPAKGSAAERAAALGIK